MEPLEWDAQDPSGSLERWADRLNEEARRQFLEAGTHIEIFFVFNETGLMEVVPIMGVEKDDIVRELKSMLDERDGYAFIHISEGTARHMDHAPLCEQVGALQDSGEVDMLLVHAESREGLSVVYCNTVALRGDEKLLLDPVKIDGHKLSGRFVHIFKDL
jgi:hypothetical protein